MKRKTIVLICIFLFAIVTVGFASANQDVNQTDDTLTVETASDNIDVESSADEDSLSGVELDIEEGETFEIGNEEENYFDLESDDEDLEGTVSIKIGGKPATLKYEEEEDYFYIINDGKGSAVSVDEDHDASFCIDKLNPGVYTLEVIFKGKTSSNNLNKNVTINVIRKGQQIVIDNDEPFIQGTTSNKLYIIAPESCIKVLNVKIGNKDYKFINDGENRGYVDISQLNAGIYDVVVTGGGLTATGEIEVVIAIYCPEIFTVGSDESISIRLPENAVGNLSITDSDGNVLFNEALKDGRASYSLSNLKVGEYEYYAEYTGEDYDVDDEVFEFTVTPLIKVPARMTVGENKVISFDFGDKVTGTLKILADYDEYKTVKVNSRTVSISLADLEDGYVDLSVEYLGDDGTYFEAEYEIEVLEVEAKLLGGKDIVMYYNDGHTYKLKVYDVDGKLACGYTVEIIIGNKEYIKTVDNNGYVTLKITNPPGKYTIRASYEDTTVKNKLTVKSMISLKKVNVKKSAKKLVIKATLKKKLKGVKIIFKFNGKKYTAKTNKKGVAKITVKKNVLKKLKVGKKVKYQASYLKNTVKMAVKVKK